MTNIVVRNKFTNINNQSNGNTPSEFVKAYTLRKSATELVYPVSSSLLEEPMVDTRSGRSQVQSLRNTNKKVVSDYLSKTESDDLYNEALQLEGRCFSLSDISLGRSTIEETTDRIQTAFDNAHTIMLVVTSFDTDFLREVNVLRKESPVLKDKNPEGLIADETDELKLRQAVQQGLIRLTENLGYTEPIAIGSIQLDTDNPHAHIVLCESADKDKSRAKMFYDGCEWGTLTPQQIDLFTNTIEHNLELNKELNPYPSSRLRKLIDLEQHLVQANANTKLYGQLSALSILPSTDKLAQAIKKDVQESTGLSNKHTRALTKEVKDRKKDRPTTVSPFIQLQVLPLANQDHLSKELKKFAKRKKVRNAANKALLDSVKNQYEKSVQVLRTQNLTDPTYSLAQLELINSLYDKEANDPYVYIPPVSNEKLTQYKEDISDLAELARPTSKEAQEDMSLTLAQEQLLETSVNACLDGALNARDVMALFASNFAATPEPKKFKDKIPEEDLVKNSNILKRRIEQVRPLAQDITSQHFKEEQYVLFKQPNESLDTPITVEREPVDPTLSDRIAALEELFELEAPIEVEPATISKNDALDIVHNLTKVEKDFGPDF